MFSLSLRTFHSLIITPALLSLFFAAKVNSDNQPPVAVPDRYTVHNVFATPADSPPFGVLQNDSDPDGDPLSCVFSQMDTSLGTALVFTDGSADFFAAHGKTGTVTVPYTVCDNHAACTESTITFDVVNQAPVATTDEFTVHGVFDTGDDPAPHGVLKNDTDPDGDTLSCLEKRVDTAFGTALIYQNGQASFVQNSSGHTGDVNFAYTVCDNLGACSEGTVIFHVVNHAPIPGSDVFVVRGPVYGPTNDSPPYGVLKNDSDPENDALRTSFTRVDFAEGTGLIFDDGSVNFVRNNNSLNSSATLTMQYPLRDSLGATSTGTVTFLLVGDGENDGLCSGCADGGGSMSLGDPVNVSNGNMYLQQSDYSLPSIGPGINITRTFNSDSQRTGLFGRGWSTIYDESMTTHGDGLRRFDQSDGRAIYWGRAAGSSGAFSPLVGDFHANLSETSAGSTITSKDGTVRQFNSAGHLISIADRSGNTTTLSYDGSGSLSSVTDPFGRTLTVTTNANGQVTSISDSLGQIATYTYGGSNELLSVTYADNSALVFTYDGGIRLTSVTDSLGNIVESHTYDGQGRAMTSEKQGGVDHYTLNFVAANETDATDGLGRLTKYTFDTSNGRNVVTRVEGLCSCGDGNGSQIQTWTYDNQLNVTSKVDALGHVMNYTYDPNGNRLTETDTAGTVTYTYNAFAEVLTRTDQIGGVTTNTYDAQGNLLTSTNALGKTTNLIYDPRGLLLTVTDARGKLTTFTYDTSGNLVKRTDALNHDTQFAYDPRARLTSTTNTLGFATAFVYDAVGRLTQVTQPDTTTIGYQYDSAGRRIAMTDAKGNRSTFAYDGASRLTSQTDAANQTTSYAYDAMSNLTSVTDALSRTTNYDYDDFNRLVKITYPPSTTGAARLFETISYDADGNVTQRADTAGRATNYAYDDLNRVVSTTDALNEVTSFEYDALSRMTALVDAIGQRYRFNYDVVGQLKHMRRGTEVMSFTYDPVGNRKTRTDYNGAATDYTYDALNRLKTISYPDNSTVGYTYDKLSRLQTATNENGTVNLDYNKMNRVTTVTDVFGQAVDYNYDANGNRTKLSLNAAIVQTYKYDAVDRLTKILDAAGLAFTYDYDATNKLTQRKMPNGVKTTYQYDGVDRLTRLLDMKGAAMVADHQYAYNTASQITQIAEPAITKNYGYDAVDRLTSANYTSPLQPNENYSYDGVGNRLASQLSANYTYQRFNRLTSTSGVTYVYDADGNMTSKTDASGATQYAWDFENRLKQVTLPNGTTVGYKYDALGRRIQRTPSIGASTNFVYDGQDVLKDLNSDGSTVDYLNGPGVDNKLRLTDSRLIALGPLYFLQDQLGSTTALTNSLGAPVAQVSYDAFGNSNGSSLTRYDYTGRERDAITGLLYYRARWYDPQVGRFISEDPIGLSGGINQFVYVENNPILHADSQGEWPSMGPLKVHQSIIRRVLGGIVTPDELRILMQEQEDFDRGTQDEVYAHMHAMSRRGEDRQDARRKANRFIRQQICIARRLAANGHMSDAMRNLADAIHTLQDSTSPAHANFAAAWDPTWGQMLNHLPHDYDESFDPGSGSVADEQTLKAWKYFAGELAMPADFFVNDFDINKYGRGYYKGAPAPDGGTCCK